MNLRYDLPEDADGGHYVVSIEYDETRERFYVVDESDAAAEHGDPEWTEIGEWRAASLWLARQLLVLGSPIALVGSPSDGAHPLSIGFPSAAARDLSDDEVLRLLNDTEA